jgi:Tol biopolymer transport system component
MIDPTRPLMMLFLTTALLACAGTPAQMPTSSVLPDTPASTLLPTPVRGAPSPAPASSSPNLAATSSLQTIHPLTGRIVFSHDQDIYVMHADGSQRARLTTEPAPDFDPVWSPDGATIAFRSHRDGNEEVYLMNADGSDQRNLSQAPGTDYSPAWSPDGTTIAFHSDRSGSSSIWVIRPDSTDLRQITTIPGISEYPTWSPDSTRIAFHCTFGRVLPQGVGDFEICVVNADGTGLTQVTDAPGESKLPAWSPDGSTIAFQSNRHGWPTLPGYVPPAYEPDRFGEFEIYLMNSDGSDVVNLTNHPREDDTEPAWSRDGRLVFSRYGCLMVMTANGSGLMQLTPDGACADGFPDWYQPER